MGEILEVPNEYRENNPYHRIWNVLQAMQSKEGFFEECFGARDDSIEHFRMLMPKALVYMFLKGHFPSDLQDYSENQWFKFTDNLLKDTERRDELSDLLINKNVSTFVPNRYLPVLMLAKSFHLDVETAADLGCGCNLGLPYLTQETSLYDHTMEIAGTEIMEELAKNRPSHLIDLKKIYGFDMQDRDIDWTIACDWPAWIESEGRRIRRLDIIAREQDVEYHKMDLTKEAVPDELAGTCDLVHSTMFYYLLDAAGREAVDKNALKLLHEGGIFIQTEKLDDTANFWTPYSVKTYFRYKVQGDLTPIDSMLKYDTNGKRPTDSCALWKWDA